MRGFLKCKSSDKILEEKRKEIMKAYGFETSYEYNCFIKRGYGAFMQNVVRTVFARGDELLEQFNDLIDKGYNIVLGPPAPNDNGLVYTGSIGVYCNNYNEILNKGNRRVLKK